MNEWQSVRLGDLAEVKGGKRLPKDHTLQSENNGSPYIRIADCTKGAISDSNFLYVPELAQPYIDRDRVSPGDVFLSIVGTVGLVAQIPKSLDGAFLTENAAKLTVTPDRLDASFLRYVLASEHGQQLMQAQTVGSTQPKLALHRIRDLLITLPPMQIQRAIAGVLGALDDKISANTRLERTLDEYIMARWRQVKRPAEVPKRSLDSMIAESIGGDWGVDQATPTHTEAVQCMRGADISSVQESGLGKMPNRFVKRASLERRSVRHGDIVVEMSGGTPTQSTGRAALVTDQLLSRVGMPIVSSNFCRVLRLKDSTYAHYVYAMLRWDWINGEFFQFENGSTGIKNLAFREYSARKLVPDFAPGEIATFNSEADAVLGSAHALGDESERLAATRDALLPQLMSGKLRVRDAEKVLEGVL